MFFKETQYHNSLIMNTLKTIYVALILSMMSYAVHAQTPCIGGMAAGYPCNNVDLYAMIPLSDMGSAGANDIWGWTSTVTGKEYVLIGLLEGTGFVDISNPTTPIYLGMLPTQTSTSTWRDIKTHENYAYIVSEAGNHGIQVFDLLQLDNVVNPPVAFEPRSTFDGLGTSGAHNIVINECSGYAYAVGTNQCSGGLLAVNLNDPDALTFDGCFSAAGYTHDAQCVDYIGPDPDHAGKEICFNSNGNSGYDLAIVDVVDKTDMTLISTTAYANQVYTHQGWTTEDQEYFLMNDEIDEGSNGHNTRTHIWDIRDLDAPVYMNYFESENASTDHNLYIRGDRAYLSNYSGGLRIYDIGNIASASLNEVAYFDVYPSNNNVGYIGTWSNYPYFESNVIAVTNRSEGLFLVKYDLCGDGTLNCNGTSLVCGGSTCTPCTRTGCAGVDLNINFDNSSNQTSWEIMNDNGDLVASSYGTYASGMTNANQSACLADGCYTLTVRDAINNGMCPFRSTASSLGTFITPGTIISPGTLVATLGTVVSPGLCGNYSLTDANGTVLASGGGSFGSSETSTFCIVNGVAELAYNPSDLDNSFQNNNDVTTPSMVIRPNLATDQITLTHTLEQEQTLQWTIIDLTGKVIRQQAFDSNIRQIDINVSDLQAGFYFMQLNDEQHILTKKFIKN